MGLKDEINGLTTIISTDGNRIIIASTLDNLAHGSKIDTNGHGTVTPVLLKPISPHQEHHQDDVGAVHGLQTHPTRGELKVGIIDQVLEGLDDLFENGSFAETGFEHR